MKARLLQVKKLLWDKKAIPNSVVQFYSYGITAWSLYITNILFTVLHNPYYSVYYILLITCYLTVLEFDPKTSSNFNKVDTDEAANRTSK